MSDIWSKLLPANNTAMKVTPPKFVQKKQLSTFFMKGDMKIHMLKTKPPPLHTKTTLSGWSQSEDTSIIFFFKSSQFLLSSQIYILFSKSAMIFDLGGGILNSEN